MFKKKGGFVVINNNSKVKRLENMVKNLMIRVTALEEFVKIPKEELP
jgi:hypothetical protein